RLPARRGAGLMLVHLRGLEKRFGARRALAGIDLDLDGHEIFGVVGPDGAGKTPLLRTVAGLLDVTAVAARGIGAGLRGDVSELPAHVGYVREGVSLPRDLSVLENLKFTARLHRIPEADFARRADGLLKRTGLDPFRARPAGALSGGMKQKLAIANALLVE